MISNTLSENQNLNIKADFLINQKNIMNIESIKKSKNYPFL